MNYLPSKTNKGLILSKPKGKDLVFGSKRRLGGLPLNSTGQWDASLPPEEHQKQFLETSACVSFNTLNPVEILELHEYGEKANYSDRFLAKMSGTTKEGNDPHTVGETLRKKGCVIQEDWPWTEDLNRWDEFYSDIPDEVKTLALAFKAKYDFGHQYVNTDPQTMMTALMYSPLGVDVFAWGFPDSEGIYHREGRQSGHWTVVYGYEYGKYWKCFDTYPPFRKKLEWNYGFSMVKQYTLHKQVVDDRWFAIFIVWLKHSLGWI